MKKRFCVFALLLAVSVLFSACSLSGLIPGIENTGDNPPASIQTDDVVERVDENTEKMTHYDKDGKLIYTHIIAYDEENRIIHRTAYDANGIEMGSFDFVYNENGDELEGVWYFKPRGYLMKSERKYDEDGRVVELYNHGDETRNVAGNMHYFHYGENGLIDVEISYSSWHENGTHSEPSYSYRTYDEHNKLIRNETRTEQGEMIGYNVYENNENGQRISSVSYDANGNMEFREEYTYDENGKKIEDRRYDAQGNLISTYQY